MESVVLSFQIVFPLFFMMAVGYVMRLCRLWDDAVLNKMNGIVFKVFLPVNLFASIYHTDLKEAFNGKLISFSLICLLVVFLLLCILVPRFIRDNKRRGAVIQGMFRGNTIMFAMALMELLYGAENVGMTALVVAVVVPVYNVMSVVEMELFRGSRIDGKKIVRGIVTNPLIIGAVVGVLALLLNIRIPQVLDDSIGSISKIASPLALMVLGGSFHFSAVRENLKPLLSTVVVKLVALPAVTLPIAVAMGFSGMEIGILLAIFAVPTATSSFTMAQQMDSDYELAGQIVVFTSALSIVTIFGWICVLKLLALI